MVNAWQLKGLCVAHAVSDFLASYPMQRRWLRYRFRPTLDYARGVAVSFAGAQSELAAAISAAGGDEG